MGIGHLTPSGPTEGARALGGGRPLRMLGSLGAELDLSPPSVVWVRGDLWLVA